MYARVALPLANGMESNFSVTSRYKYALVRSADDHSDDDDVAVFEDDLADGGTDFNQRRVPPIQ